MMKISRKAMLCGLALALAVSLAMPVATLAKAPVEDFTAAGIITGVSEGDVSPAGNSGWWIVRSRQITGTLSGDIEGDFTFTYSAVVDSTQAGRFVGRLTVDDSLTIRARGRSQPVEMVEVAPGVFLPKLSVSGKWRMTGELKGRGHFEAWFLFIPTFDAAGNMHIGQIVASAIAMTGTWRPEETHDEEKEAKHHHHHDHDGEEDEGDDD